MRSIKIDEVHKERRNHMKIDSEGIEKFEKPIDIGFEGIEPKSIEPKQDQNTMKDVMNLLK